MGVCALATWKGRDEERLAAGGLLAGWALTRVTYSDPSHTQWGVLAVDISLLWLLGWIALRSRRYWPLFAVGFFVSFVAAWFCVRWLLKYISTHTFVPFAWYRIVFGIVVLFTAFTGLVSWVD